MTVAALTPYVEYAENGVTLNFAAAFKYGAATNLLVRRQLADGSHVVLTYGADWNATAGPTDAGGTVTLTASIAGTTLKIKRVTVRTQQTDYVTNDSFPAESHEAALDRLTQIVQEQDVDAGLLAGRALQVPEGESVAVLPARENGKFLVTDASGAFIYASGSGADGALRADLAGVNGDALVKHGSTTVKAALDALELANGTPFEPDVLPVQVLAPQSRGQREVLRELHRRTDRTAIDAVVALSVGERRNLWGQSEALASSHYAVTNSTKQTETIVVDGITLTRLTCNNFYSALRSQVAGLGYTPFTTGQRYLVSCFVLEVSATSAIAYANDDDKFVWMRTLALSSSQAHGPKLIGNRMRRIWMLGHATSTSALDLGASATVALGGGGGTDPYWVFSAQNGTDNREIYLGGFQIDHVGDGTYKDGIAGIGDSTMQGSSSNFDSCQAREWMGYLAALLNVPTFNRAVGGERLDQMDSRWATDITPLAVTCADVIISGGVNDIVAGRTLAQMQASVNSMVAKAVTDGLRPIVVTATPTTSIAANTAYETLRGQYNTWLKRTFAHVLDAAAVIEDPHVPSKIRVDAGWTGDGVHFGQSAKRALGAFCAAWPHWNKREPGPYQANAGNANTWTPPATVLRGSAGQLIGQRETGWTAGTGTALKGAFAAYAGANVSAAYVEAEAQATDDAARNASQRVKAIEDALRTHGLIN